LVERQQIGALRLRERAPVGALREVEERLPVQWLRGDSRPLRAADIGGDSPEVLPDRLKRDRVPAALCQALVRFGQVEAGQPLDLRLRRGVLVLSASEFELR